MNDTGPDDRLSRVRDLLQSVGQTHLLNFYDQLDQPARTALLDQIENQPWPLVQQLIPSHVLNRPPVHLPDNLQPAPCLPRRPTPELADTYRQARRLGEQLVGQGKVAAFVVAGGQGSRLGFDGPKGAYPATPITRKPLFQVFAEFLLKTAEKYGRPVPWYIMTSRLNHQATIDFFKQHRYFGLDEKQLVFFSQGTLPSIGYDGRALLADKHRLAVNPDGHGGSLRALHVSGALDDMAGRGVEYISYFQVDNPNVKCIDPLFIGLHALHRAQMSSKMIPKTGPFEKVGNFALADGRVTVIEYSDLPDHLAEQRNPDGSLTFNAGSIAIHVISRRFVEQLNADGRFSLPFHRADKIVPCIDPQTGQPIRPDKPNAVKLETFVFDALPLCSTSIILETDRVEEFAPIKNATGVDSALSSQRLQTERAARWLEQHGLRIPRRPDGSVDAVIELSHTTAIEPDDLADADLPPAIESSQRIAL